MKSYWAISSCLLLPSVTGLVVDAGQEQGVLSSSVEANVIAQKAVVKDSFVIFNEVNGLLRQWGNALRPNGFSVTLASVPPNTLLYHARTDPDEPSSPEWFAFDAEMSYGIYGGRKNTSVFLRTYRTTATLGPLLYFNGLSAALTFSGTLDSQDLLVPPLNTSNNNTPFEDYARAERLCAWASTRHIAGFVRTNAGFELLWCDMQSHGLKLVRNVDVTRWADEMDDHSDRTGSDKDGERGGGPGRHRGPPPDGLDRRPFPGHPEPGGRPPGKGFNMFAQYASWEWLRAASHTYDGLGESRVQLHPGWHVTARGIVGSSNSESGPTSRMASLSNGTIAIWREEVDEMLRMGLEERRENSRVDWRALTDLIVARYGDRLPQLKELLNLAHQSSILETHDVFVDHGYTSFTNASTHLQHAYRLISSLVLPFFDHETSKEERVETCTNSITPDLTVPNGEMDVTTSYERKLWAAITHVHRSICSVLIDTHSELIALRPHQPLLAPRAAGLEASVLRVEQLISQLDWSVWVRCPEVCAWGQVCYIPIWPLVGFGSQNRTWWPMPSSGRPEPQCAGSFNL